MTISFGDKAFCHTYSTHGCHGALVLGLWTSPNHCCNRTWILVPTPPYVFRLHTPLVQQMCFKTSFPGVSSLPLSPCSYPEGAFFFFFTVVVHSRTTRYFCFSFVLTSRNKFSLQIWSVVGWQRLSNRCLHILLLMKGCMCACVSRSLDPLLFVGFPDVGFLT